MTKEKFVKYGGVKFTNTVEPKEINNFVRNLPAEKKDSLFEVIQELDKAGLISLEHEFSTLDDETLEWQQ
ncbi:hypothetical protein [Thermincola potens]|uniref:Uncharacterized protein n=1 Tax=Thermincola potens (strain JR) TaxID=635013 RepID=D5X892_THEPJ|nr:hypothetical protein [Thermincola potens]ADG82812.1 conserved hypothetical protein [Thermincola potens JR]